MGKPSSSTVKPDLMDAERSGSGTDGCLTGDCGIGGFLVRRREQAAAPPYETIPFGINCFHGGGRLKTSRKKLIICLAIPLAVGGISALLTKNGMEKFKSLNQPPLSPPGWLFPVVWTVLFLMMGAASYLVWRSGRPSRSVRRALLLYGVQLGFNFLWSILFFNLSLYLAAFIWLVALWLLILAAAVEFYRVSRGAGYLMVPYLLWVAFAGYLNFGVFLLN